jgi:uncharacterized phage protein gp47/JayE
MPWSTPTLREVRSLVRDNIRGSLPGADAAVPNSVLRVVGDAQSGLCHLNLQYLDWLALQQLPDTAETEWLDRHGDIWLKNADDTVGRKMATSSVGTATFVSEAGSAVVPLATRLVGGAGLEFETTEQIVAGTQPSPAPIRCLDTGAITNLEPGTNLGIVNVPPGVQSNAAVVHLEGGTDQETDDQLRIRILQRIQAPPMGGDADDYITWTLRVPGVTRAWSYPLEMGMGTVTVRFMMDDLRADQGGFPLPADCETVRDYLNTVRPVTVKDFWVVSPIPLPIDMQITYLDSDDAATRAAITDSLLQLFIERTMPGQKWWRSWTDEGIAAAAGVYAYDLLTEDVTPSSNGYMPILGNIRYG